MKVTSAYIQSPFKISLREIDLPAPGPNDVLVEVLGCGICGYDIETATSLAPEPRPFGHEIVGTAKEVGSNVKHVSVGEQVTLESSSFCCDCADCRNGRVDLCNRGANFSSGKSMGFSDALIAPGRCIVPAPNIDSMSAVLAEPCGVAVDVIKVAEIGLSDKVLILGGGPIGLMVAAIARKVTTGTIVVADNNIGRLEIAKELGADGTICTKESNLVEACGQFGAFNRVLITAPPQTLPDAITVSAYGAYIVFIGSDFKGGGVVPIDTHAVHFGKKQLRSSFASPALYFPQALELLRKGVVPADKIVTHRFPLSKIEEAFDTICGRKENAIKVAVIPDSKF
ncbi:MAG: zinc-dependent alcohol dehydrogenase [Armatimonadota bacterium]